MMAKTKAPIAAEVLAAAESDLANDERRLVEIAQERAGLDPLAGDFLDRAEKLDSEKRLVEARASTLRARQSDVARVASLERAAAHEQALLSARADVQTAFEGAIGYILGQRPLLVAYQEAVGRLAGLGGHPWPGQIVPGAYVYGVEVLLMALRTSSPQLLGLPANLTRAEEVQRDAIADCENVIHLWSAADAGAHDGSTNADLRFEFSKRAEDLLAAVDRAQARCRQVGAKPPSGPLSLMGQLLNFLDKQAKALERARLDREEDRLLAQATPDTPGSMAILADRKDRRRP
ncbi:MAG: hypothetical protein MUO85_10755 [candidate division Zixibacteria bacterium]|nr:hypothetical protein [candidate division Zixibacteria bacterium]